jgi:hypothetical protein
MKPFVFLILSLLILTACNSGGDGIKVLTAGITAPLLLEIEGQNGDGQTLDLGEQLLTDDPKSILVTIHNSTAFPYTELDLVFTATNDQVPSLSFKPNLEGSTAFPGYGGTCTGTLPPGTSCNMNLVFSPRESRYYEEILTLNFKNYVDRESHTAHLKFLAGTPASLAFTNDLTQYNIGTLVGSNSTPVVERSETSPVVTELEIVNAGGLSAKNNVTTLVESCLSSLTNACPTNMFGAYLMENNCPALIHPNEKCKIKVTYLPKNQDLVPGPTPDDMKEINYRATLNLTYIREPSGNTGALNGYFRSVSTNIEAKFKVSQATVSFDQPVISGNRDVRTIRINNIGYREGVMKSIGVRDVGGSLIALCKPATGKSFLECRDSSNAILSLAAFPFNIKDRAGCIEHETEVAVGSGCIFDFYFQPSVTYLTDKETEFQNLQPEVTYDSRLKGLVNIVTTKLFNLSAKSKAAARLVLDRIVYNGIIIPTVGTFPGPWVTDFGKVTLQSPSYFQRKPIIVSFKNVGSVDATATAFKDGMNRIIQSSGAGGTLGASAPYYYTSVIANESTCTVIPPGGTCSITLMFAAIGMSSNTEEDANMFDTLIGGIKYKNVLASYASGAIYSDTNTELVAPDYPAQVAESRVKAILLRKGMLQQLADDTRNVNNVGSGVYAGDTTQSHIFLRNIGTGPVPYIRLQNPPYVGYSSNFHLVPTADPAALGAEFDCLSSVDYDLSGSVPANASPAVRGGHFVSLPKDQSCVYTIEFKSSDAQKVYNYNACNNDPVATSRLEEGGRYFSREAEAAGGGSLWEYCEGNVGQIRWNDITIDYYDGDLTDSALPYGAKSRLNLYSYAIFQSASGKLIPYNVTPYLSATIYRPSYTLPTITNHTAKTFPDTWFYGITTDLFTAKDDPANLSPFIQGDEARNYLPTTTAFGNRATYDYIYYMGSFPQGSPNTTVTLSFRNFGTGRVIVKSLTALNTTGMTFTGRPTGFPISVASSGLLSSNFKLKITPTAAGEHTAVVDIVYESGRHTEPLYFNMSTTAANAATAGKEQNRVKVLIVADVPATGTYPTLSATTEDYNITQNNGAPPTVTIGAPYASALSSANNAVASTVVYDTIKLTAPATANDVYAQKRITLKNNSTQPLTNLFVGHRTTETSSSLKTMTSSYKTISSTCVNDMTLAPNATCEMIVKFQPGISDTTETAVMTFVYRSVASQVYSQNLGISLIPRSPGNIVASGVLLESINYKPTSTSSVITRSSYPLNFNSLNLDEVPKVLTFDQSTGTYKKFTMINQQTTKASLLLSYHKNLQANSLRGYSPTLAPANSVVPDPSEYVTIDGYPYVSIYLQKYSNGDERLKIQASKGCLFGDDELNGTILDYQKGFSSTTSAANPCYVVVTLKANFDYLYKTISVGNGDDMRENAAELWYYSVNRSSTASTWVHVKGTFNPDVSLAAGSFANIQAFDNKTANFKTPLISASNVAVGSLVGLRVLMSTSASTLNTPYSLGITTYVDIRPYSYAALTAAFTTGLLNGSYHYFRVVGIRKHTSFAYSSRFVGLGANEYLSASSSPLTVLTLLVPPIGHYYFHDQKLLVEKTLTGGVAYDPWPTADNKCATKIAATLKNPSATNYGYHLINRTAWSLLLATPAATTYANMSQTSHWTSEPVITVDSAAGSLPGFVANNSSQILTGSSVFYVRNSGNYALPVYTALGGVPGTTYSNYQSYVDGAVGFASARCMIFLP